MGFFGLGKRSAAPSPASSSKASPAVKSGNDKATLAESALRGADPAVRAAALDKMLADPSGYAAQLAIVAVQDPEGQAGARAASAVPERRLLKDIQRKAKSAVAREAAARAIVALDTAATKPSEEKARAARVAALEELIPRATRLAVGDGRGAGEAWTAIQAERDVALATCPELPLCARASAVIERLNTLDGEITARIAAAAERVQAEAVEATARAEAERIEEARRAALAAEAAGRRMAPAPEGLPAIINRAEELVGAADAESAVDEFLRLHKDWMRLSDGLDPQHEMRTRFLRAWDAHRDARKSQRAARGQQRTDAIAALSACVAEARRLAEVADTVAPEAGEALSAHQSACDALRNRFRDAQRDAPPGEIRAARDVFQTALDDAYAPLRAAREAADAESFTNMVRAEQLTDEINGLPVDSDPAAAFRGLKEIQARWRRIGPLPRAKARTSWDAFRAAGDACFAKLKPWLEAQDKERAAAMARREALCVEVETVLAAPAIGLPGSPAERDGRRATSIRMRELQRAWREAGEVPRGMDRGLWERFKKAQDAFWERHKADLDVEREQRESAAGECEDLVKRAEEFAVISEKAMAAKSGVITAADVQRRVRELRDAARDLPPVPREARAVLEQRFNDAIDRILATIRGKLDADRAALEAAAVKRGALCAELEEILAGENPRWQTDAVDRIRRDWREAGRVPAEVRETLDRRFTDLLGKWRTLTG